MNIQSYIDRKRKAGAREHEGNSTDWAGWMQEQFLAAIAGELLDAINYTTEMHNNGHITPQSACFLRGIYAIANMLEISAYEAACQEAEQVQEDEEPEDLNPWRLSNLPIEKPLRP